MDDKIMTELDRLELAVEILKQRIALYNALVRRALIGGGK